MIMMMTTANFQVAVPTVFLYRRLQLPVHTRDKTCSAGQSKFKALTIKRQSLPAHLVTFWCHLRK